MPDFLDHVQERVAAESDALQQRARLPDVEPPKDRDCDDCGSAIHPRRLAAVPTATRCITCEEVRAKRQAFMGRPRA